MRYEFLSPAWIDAVRTVRDEYVDELDGRLQHTGAPVAVNLLVTGMPDRGADVRAHAAVTVEGTSMDLGHHDEAKVLVTLDYRTARAAVVDQDLKAIVRGFLLGKIAIRGDLAGLLGQGNGDPTALLTAFDVSGVSTIGELDPTAGEIAERIRALTV